MAADGLKLLIEDAADLDVVSATLQDAVAKVGDIRFEQAGRRLTIVFNRYRWESGARERVRCAIQVGSVTSVQARRIRRGAKEAFMELLAVNFEPGEPPGGALTFSFAGGGDLRVTVECMDAILADISEPWRTAREPRHES